jgi:hypothetical protein
MLAEVTYINGWPHGSLTQAAAEGANSLAVDDITGWLGAVGTIYGTAEQEAVQVTAVTPNTAGAISGPGTLTLGAGLRSSHQVGDLVTTFPGAVIQAGILYSVMQALTRGATSTAVQSISGGVSGSGGLSPDALRLWAERLLGPFKRRI